MAASLLRRALRVSLTLVAATVAGVAAHVWAADAHAQDSFGLHQAAIHSPAPRIVGAESRRGHPVVLGSRMVSGPGWATTLRVRARRRGCSRPP